MEDRECALFLAIEGHSTTEHQKLSFIKSDILEVELISNEAFNSESWYHARNCRTNLIGYVHGNKHSFIYFLK